MLRLPVMAARRVKRFTTSETRPSEALSTTLELVTRSVPSGTQPLRQGDPAFWRGEHEIHEFLIWRRSAEDEVRAALSQVRRLTSPFSGKMSLSNGADEELSLPELTKLITGGVSTKVVITSATEAMSDEEIQKEIDLRCRPAPSPRPSRDDLINWVADNHALEGAITRAPDIREALANLELESQIPDNGLNS
eukprot:m.471403 g.471403  ORF g.471403 m.471403 type:complete len:193 (+) comp31023_c0_seq1:109-687(+)